MNKLKNIYLDIKEKTKGMSSSEKLSYFWEYYRLETFTVLFLGICIISLTSTLIGNMRRNPVLTAGLLNDIQLACSEEADRLLSEAFPDATGYEAPEYMVFSSPADQSNLYASVQLSAYLAAGDLDCGLCDTASLDYIRASERPLQILDISDSVIGKAMASYGLQPLYYFWFEDSEHADAAAQFARYVEK